MPKKEYWVQVRSTQNCAYHAALKEKDIGVVHARINYPNPKNPQLYKGIHAFFNYFALNKKYESRICP